MVVWLNVKLCGLCDEPIYNNVRKKAKLCNKCRAAYTLGYRHGYKRAWDHLISCSKDVKRIENVED